MKLAGKVALLTGAGAGIAKASAKLFAREGARVAIIELTSITVRRPLRALMPPCSSYRRLPQPSGSSDRSSWSSSRPNAITLVKVVSSMPPTTS